MWDSKQNNIEKPKKEVKEKEFVAFDWGGDGEPAPLVFKHKDESLKPGQTSDGTIGSWNQFDAKTNVAQREANEAAGGKKARGGGGGGAGKDEFYGLTSGGNKSLDHAEYTEEEKARAAALTKEILESEATGGIHQLLERGEENIAEYRAQQIKNGTDLEAMEAKRTGLDEDRYKAALAMDDATLYSDVHRNNGAAAANQNDDDDEDDEDEEVVFQPRGGM